MTKCGFVAVIGKPNSGKSSLVNALVGEKVSIVSPKPQTTRNNILGIHNGVRSQIVFVDTPGILRPQSGLDEFMQKSIKASTSDVDVLLLVCDITKGITNFERNLIDRHFGKIPLVVVLSKIDLVSEEKVFQALSEFSPYADKCDVVPLSSLKHRNLNTLIEVIEKRLPESEQKIFENDEYTDKPLNFLIAEIIREKALHFLNEEIPHGIAVIIQSFENDDSLITISADIICEKASHKPIILGKKGEMLRSIGHNARLTIQKILQKKVMLNFFVKVKPNWKNNLEILGSLGYNINDL